MFHISGSLARRLAVIATAVLIIAATALGTWLSARSTDSHIRSQLTNRTASVADLLDANDIAALTGSPQDLSSRSYQKTKRTLAKLKESNPDIRSLYIAELRDDRVYFYVDSEQAKSDYYSPPGEYYPSATPLFKSLFVSGKAAVEGPTQDAFGSWVSGLAPIRNQDSGKVIAVLGMDSEAGNYYRLMAQSVIVPVLLGVIALAVVVSNEVLRMRQERLLKLQSELVSIASHELRSPLAGVRWATESLIPHLDDANKIMAQRILVSASQLQASIDDILQISRVASPGGHKHLELADHDLMTLVRDVCQSQQLAAEQKGVSLTLDGSWASGITVHCDADRIKRALQNVISNAIKYTREDTEVYINYHFNGDAHQVRITDQGIGIPEGETSKIFQGFYRASNAQASNVKGTGLGLYLTRTVLEQHGGKVSVDSKENVGTTITLTLPA